MLGRAQMAEGDVLYLHQDKRKLKSHMFSPVHNSPQSNTQLSPSEGRHCTAGPYFPSGMFPCHLALLLGRLFSCYSAGSTPRVLPVGLPGFNVIYNVFKNMPEQTYLQDKSIQNARNVQQSPGPL